MLLKNKILSLIFLSIISSNIIIYSELSESIRLCEKVCKDCPLLGKYPQEIGWIINGLKNNRMRGNRMILWGNPKNGKRLIAQTIAKLTDSEFYFVDTTKIVHCAENSHVEIKKEFKKALQICNESPKKRIIIFFDAIKNLTTPTSKENQSKYLAILNTIRYYLDKHEDNPQIFIICATNSLSNFNYAFRDRFNFIIEISDPNLAEREEIIQHYSNEYDTTLSPEQIKNIAQNSEGASRGSLENLVDYLRQQALNSTNNVINEQMIERRLISLKTETINKINESEKEKKEEKIRKLQYESLEFDLQERKLRHKEERALAECMQHFLKNRGSLWVSRNADLVMRLCTLNAKLEN